MSIKRVLQTLAGLGLNESDAKIYVFLAKKGPHTGKDLCNAMNLKKPQVYPCLKNLQTRGLVNATPERPALFSAEPFERVLDLLVEDKMKEAQRTQKDREEALTYWQSMMTNEHEKE